MTHRDKPLLRQAWLENACLHSAEGEAEADKIVRALERRHGWFPDRSPEPAAERTRVR